jgi:hypothetical protein
VSNKRDQIINFLEKKFPTDEDKIAYIKKLQDELKEIDNSPVRFDTLFNEN